MFLQLRAQEMEVYQHSVRLVQQCYLLTQRFPAEEKFGMSSQMRRAALSVHLNLAEGSGRRSITERLRYLEVARGSLVEIDAALDIAQALGYLNDFPMEPLQAAIVTQFKLLSGFINHLRKQLQNNTNHSSAPEATF